MEVQLRKYKIYVRDLKFMLVCSGLWPKYDKHPKVLVLFLRFCSTFTISFLLFGVVLLCITYVTNLNYFFKGMSLVVSFSSGLLKIATMIKRQKDLSNLNEGLSAQFEKDLEDPENRIHLLSRFPTFSKFFYIFDYMAVVSIGMFAFISMSLIRKGKYVLMYPVVLPFSYEPGGTIFWTVYGIEIMSGFFLWSSTCGTDSIIGYYALHMVGELRLLSAKFRQLKSGDNYKKDLKECVDRHCMLVEAKKTLERIFGFLTIWLAVSCAVALCPLIFQISKTKHFSPLRLLYIISYMIVKLLQAYSFAWFGTVLNFESQACLNSAYKSFWRGSGDVRFMNDILIILSQKPLVFNAKGIMRLEMNMFSKILNTSVSYFCLLQTIEEKS